jgi:hypothetical protein
MALRLQKGRPPLGALKMAAASFGLASDSLVDVVQSVEERAAPCEMKSDHCDGRHFFNPTGPQLQPFRRCRGCCCPDGHPWPKLVTQVVVQPSERDYRPRAFPTCAV